MGCPQCTYPNDESFRFCQSCGYRRAPFKKSPISLKVPVNIQDIRRRKLELTCRRSATPSAVVDFLISKDNFGTTNIRCTNIVAFFLDKGTIHIVLVLRD